MIKQDVFPVEPWCVRETRLNLDILAQTESVFALSNGHIGLRANLDEGEPHDLPGTYLNSVHERRPLPYAEGGYGYPESGQTVINVTNGKLIRLLVDDEPFDVRYGHLKSHERVLDLRGGFLHRTLEWKSPAGPSVRVSSQRLVSFVQRSAVAICYEVTPVDREIRVVIQSELVANEKSSSSPDDPRAAAVLDAPLHAEMHSADGTRGELVHSTRRSGIRVGVAMDHLIEAPAGAVIESESADDTARVTVAVTLAPGQSLRLVKFITYGWSATRSLPAVADQVAAALVAARRTGWDGMLAEQREYLDDFWDRADVEVDGDTQIQQAARFALFHVLQAGARAEQRAIPGKGLTGPGYDGHSFWDTETFVLPVLTSTVPQAAGDALRWRHSTLPLARERAAQLGLDGAAFPWRTIHGEECSGYWPAGTAAFHVNADIADAVIRYVGVTGDTDFEREIGLELLAETARMWRSLGHHDRHGAFRIDGVTGPDEYSAVADNNVYTNLMAQRNLRGAAEAAARHPKEAEALAIDDEETAEWRDAAEAIYIPYDEALGVHPQSDGFTSHQVWDFAGTPAEHYPLLLHYPYFDLYRKQVVKQADLILAMQFRGDAFTDEQKARNFAYYEAITVRDSSLSACCQAVIAAEVGQLALAHDYLAEAALMDLNDLENNTRDGLHIASLAGTWIALVGGFGGMRAHNGDLTFKPRLPDSLTRLAFGMSHHGRRLRVEIDATRATYSIDSGDALTFTHHGESVTVTADQPTTVPIPRLSPPPPRPRQPAGRAPTLHRPNPEATRPPADA
ncbi:MAG: glycoside hydrolase family 65 protein [Frankia sp.]